MSSMRHLIYSIFTGLLLVISGCGGNELESSGTMDSGENNPGTRLRIVSLAPSISAWMDGFGFRQSMVGCTDFCQVESGIKRVGGLTTPSIEAVVSLSPDIVMASNLTPEPVLTQLASMDITTMVLPFQSLENVRTSAGRITTIHGINPENRVEPQKLLQLWDQTFTSTDSLQNTSVNHHGPGVVVLFGTQGLYSAGKGSFIEELVIRAGGTNLPSSLDSSWPQLSEEKLIAMQPDILIVHFDGVMSEADGLKQLSDKWSNRSWWSELPAIVHDNVFVISESGLSVPGPHLMDVFRKLTSWIDKVNNQSDGRHGD